ncbi:MAG: hypothetical protein WCK76_10270 [Elusimicrobiota bacterium]
MKNRILELTLLTLITNCSAAYARSSAYDENGWVTGFSPRAAAAVTVPAASVPVPVIPEPAAEPAGQNTAAQLGPELTLPAQPLLQAGPEEERTAPADYDEAAALRLARNARNHSLGAFTGWCYSYVADAMEMTGLIRRDQWYSLGIGVNAAADFAAWANRNPGTLRSQLKLAKMPTPSVAAELPLGAIVVYNRGVCGFSGRSGHIEVKVAPDQLCSDGCQPAYQACFGSAGARAGISVYVPVKKAGPQQKRFCRLTGSGDGKCRYTCNDGSDHESWMKRPDPWGENSFGQSNELCQQAVFTY